VNFDVVFVDVTTYKPYDTLTLDTEPLGGTEATLVRVADALSKRGLKVAVVQHCLAEPMLDGAVFFLPLSYLTQIKTANLVSLRSTYASELFPRARKFSWHQDVPDARINKMKPALLEHNITVVGASKWHKMELGRWLHSEDDKKHVKITHVYNACPDEIYVHPKVTLPYNKNKLVWLASPHKGLQDAIPLFSRLREVTSNALELHVFNPGYMVTEYVNQPNVVVRGPLPCKQLWDEVQGALCVFYPTRFQETFGCIASEANALHTPIATNAVAALCETVAGKHQLNPPNDFTGLIKKVEQWYKGYRPEVYGQDKFRTSVVVDKWIELLQ
jgi:glycosyltransferase involved in cell wall biosynthesis